MSSGPLDPRRARRRLAALLAGAVVFIAGYLLAVINGPPLFLGTFLIVGSLVVVALSVPAAAVGILWRRRYRIDEALFGVTLSLVALDGAVVALAAAAGGPSLAGVLFLGGGVLALGLFWVVVPLTVGALSADRLDVTVQSLLVGWPVANVLGFLLFVAPGGLGRYNVTFLEEPLRSFVLATIALVVAAGPTLIGALVDRVEDRVSKPSR